MKFLLLASFLLSATAAHAVMDNPAPRVSLPLNQLFQENGEPVEPYLQNEEAKGALTLLKQSTEDAIDRKNFEEFELMRKSLMDRGYTPLTEPLTGHVFTPAQKFSFYKTNYNTATAREYEYYYTQYFVKKNEKPSPFSVLPNAMLRGRVFLSCDEQKKCKVEATTIQHAITEWQNLPSTRGGNSSAGGRSGHKKKKHKVVPAAVEKDPSSSEDGAE